MLIEPLNLFVPWCVNVEEWENFVTVWSLGERRKICEKDGNEGWVWFQWRDTWWSQQQHRQLPGTSTRYCLGRHTQRRGHSRDSSSCSSSREGRPKYVPGTSFIRMYLLLACLYHWQRPKMAYLVTLGSKTRAVQNQQKPASPPAINEHNLYQVLVLYLFTLGVWCMLRTYYVCMLYLVYKVCVWWSQPLFES